jgi:hypothetical protein
MVLYVILPLLIIPTLDAFFNIMSQNTINNFVCYDPRFDMYIIVILHPA